LVVFDLNKTLHSYKNKKIKIKRVKKILEGYKLSESP